MRTITALLLLFSIYSCSSENAEDHTSAVNEPENSTVNTDIPAETEEKPTVEPGSKKEMLIGDWQADDDPELMLRISAEKYCTYINGQQNWDNPWDLCNYIEYAPENEDDNGAYVLVHLEDKSAVFYGQEILSITENKMTVLIVKSSGGTGMTQSFTRQ